METLIQIPADLTLVTMKDSRMTYPQRNTPMHAQQVLAKASSILETKANIKFTLGEVKTVVEEVAPGIRADAVDDAGFHYLSARYKAGRGVRVIFVDKLAKSEIGGRSREEKKIVILPFETGNGIAVKLAHEFGHLLGLALHIDEGPNKVSNDPGKEVQFAEMRNNLMYSRGLSDQALLTPAQIGTMRTSWLARQFGGKTIGDMFIPEILKNVGRM